MGWFAPCFRRLGDGIRLILPEHAIQQHNDHQEIADEKSRGGLYAGYESYPQAPDLTSISLFLENEDGINYADEGTHET